MEAIIGGDVIQQGETTVPRTSPFIDKEPQTGEAGDIAQRISRGSQDEPIAVPALRSRPRWPRNALRTLLFLLRRIATIGIATVAVLAALMTWDIYNSAPWTRDGRLRVQVASVAPQVSGQIKELRVVDNQFVRKGDILYVIDPFDFEVALRASKAALQQRSADRDVRELQSERRRRLSGAATSIEEKQVYEGAAIQAQAAVEAARQQVAQAAINLERTEVRSPVNGIVTNLLLREGDYAHAGGTNVSIIDTESYWIDGYFEETKLARLCVGDRAEAKLMGYAEPITGHIATITRGVSVANATAATQGLPNVDPVYTWIRLAQRVPVRIAIDKVPRGLPLVSGLTATVTIRNDSAGEIGTRSHRLRTDLEASFFRVFNGASTRPGCIP
ncbi:biotin/lipoyl-binding protein [Rhizobium leguminosarum]